MTEVYICGHSLGAAEASIYAYDRTVRGLSMDGLFVFGCPNPGNRVIGDVLVGKRIRSIKNMRDLVTDVPVDLQLINEEYVPVRSFEECYEKAPANDPWGVFRDHHIQLYQPGCRTLAQGTAAISLNDVVDTVARLYDTNDGWDWINPVDGQWWAARKFPGAILLIARGSTTALDWVHDFEALQTDYRGARVSLGFLQGVQPIIDKLDEAAKL